MEDTDAKPNFVTNSKCTGGPGTRSVSPKSPRSSRSNSVSSRSSSASSSRKRGRNRSISSHIRRRSRMSVVRNRSRSGAAFKKSHIACWYGRGCVRGDCWFVHPGGRVIDEERHGSERQLSTRPPQKLKRRTRSRTSHSPHSSDRNDSRLGISKSDGYPSTSCSMYSSRRLQSDCLENSHASPQDSNTGFRLNPPELSFRIFVEREMDDSASPEEASAKYSAFQQQIIHKTMESLKSSGLLFDSYNPRALLNQHNARVRRTGRSAMDFIADMERQRYADLRLVASDSCTAAVSNEVCRIIGHLQPPHFAFDPNVNALVIADIPHCVSVGDIYAVLVKTSGFLSISKPQLLADRLSRTFRVRFATIEDARSILNDSVSLQLEGNFSIKPRKIFPAQVLEALVLPPAMSLPERIVADVSLSAQVVTKLDKLFGIPPETTNVLLNLEASPEMKLDLQVLYLRRVHNFCFYGCKWCSDEWELHDTCGAAVLRTCPPVQTKLAGDKPSAVGQKWIEGHESRLKAFISTSFLETPSLPSVEEEPLRSCLERKLEARIAKLTGDKYKCTRCGKQFRGSDFVRKHLLKVHTDIFEDALSVACTDIAASAYIADLDRPGWPPYQDSGVQK